MYLIIVVEVKVEPVVTEYSCYNSAFRRENKNKADMLQSEKGKIEEEENIFSIKQIIFLPWANNSISFLNVFLYSFVHFVHVIKS